MPETRVAECCCGALKAACVGEPVLVSRCHCTECQRRTGTSAGVAAFYDRSKVSVSGQSASYVRSSDSGFGITHHFCPKCGSTVFWYPERKPDLVAVAPGAFADPGFPPPAQDVHLETRYRWPE